MSQSFAELHGRTIENLYNFLVVESRLGMTFISMAWTHRDDADRFEVHRRNAMTALEAIDRFKDKLPRDMRSEIETLRSKLAEALAAL